MNWLGKIIFGIGLCCITQIRLLAQIPYQIKAGSSLTPYAFVINASSGTTIFEAEYEIVLGPDCILYPTCSASNNYFNTTGFDVNTNNFFLARLVPPLAYAELKRQLDGSYCETLLKKLSFKYVEKYTEGSLNYQIYDYQRNEMITKPITNPALILTKKVGDNFFMIDLSLITSFVNTTEIGTYYTLEVLNEKNEKTVLRFRYSPNEQ